MILSAQSIRARCEGETPMISPFSAEKRVINGKSAGLSACSYDVCIAHDLTLYPRCVLSDPRTRPFAALAHTLEDFHMPADVAGFVVDKSSYARVFVTAFNTLLDPGFFGNLTLELVNLGTDPVIYRAGDPVCQIVFQQLDQPTDKPYASKYQGQTKAAHPARHELAGGGYVSPETALPSVVSPAGA